MSLRWIQENFQAPTCDEESSDIDDSCSDNSYDTDLSVPEERDEIDKKDTANNNNNNNNRAKRETIRRPISTVTCDENGSCKFVPYVIWDPRRPAENAIYSQPTIKLYSRTGFHLSITPSGRVCGLTDTNEPHAALSISVVSFGVIRMQSCETGFYLAFNKKGHLYGEMDMNKPTTLWEQWSIGSYDAFRSRHYVEKGWWIGIKKNGRPKPGPKTAWGQKAIQFLPIRV